LKNSYVCILANWTNNVIYVGVTNDLERRINEHKSKLAAGFTKKYNVEKLVYFEHFNDIEMAIAREKEIKGWRREKKDALVMGSNPEWRDLSEGWYEDPSHSFGMTGEEAA